jgi:energy-converting hydrogenase Eha subunit F
MGVPQKEQDYSGQYPQYKSVLTFLFSYLGFPIVDWKLTGILERLGRASYDP